MSANSIAEMLFSDDETLDDVQKLKKAEAIQAKLTRGFPELSAAIENAKLCAAKYGYTETILGRRRHLPDMQLPRFEFKAMDGYVNPDIDPLDPETLTNKSEIPERILKQLTAEFSRLKYYGQIVKRTKELAEQKIRVINHTREIEAASRECFNGIIQGSAADLTKMAILKLENDPEWKRIGGKFILPVHDELIAEVPFKYREEGERLLAKNMQDAGNFMPFPLKCDVETTFRWYGLSVDEILSHDKPTTFDVESFSEENIKWIQCMLIENEYVLPKFPNPDGSKLIGAAAEGVNGKWSPEMDAAIQKYIDWHGITHDEFIDHIERKVIYGTY